MNVIGFDFGTTNSLVAQVMAGQAIPLLNAGNPTPSLVVYEAGRAILGEEAKKRVEKAGLGIQGSIVPSPKRLLGKDGIVAVGGTEMSVADIVAESVANTLELAKRSERGGDLTRVDGAVVTIPVSMAGRARRELRDAFGRAGLHIRQFVHEPFAALYGFFRADLEENRRLFDGRNLLVVDWGGGTLDLTLCTLRNGRLFQICNGGLDDVGGDMFDEALAEHVLKQVCLQEGLEEPELRPGARARLRDQCEKAKKELSKKPIAQIFVADCFVGLEDGDLIHELSRDALENVTRPLMNLAFEHLEKLLEEAKLAPEQIALCLPTGGMVNVPAIRGRLHGIFGPARVRRADDSASLVAMGAAWIAHDGSDLILAKSVELETARNSWLPLIKAGTRMPRGGDVSVVDTMDLYCVDPRDATAKFQFGTPKRPGAVSGMEERNNLDVITVKVDSRARPFQERIRLDVEMDDDLILKLKATSLNIMDSAECEIHNLEFGLALPGEDDGGEELSEDSFGRADGEEPARTTLRFRANVAPRRDPPDMALVPGEILSDWKPEYFDVRRSGAMAATDIQRDENMYYRPCSICGRRANACECHLRHAKGGGAAPLRA